MKRHSLLKRIVRELTAWAWQHELNCTDSMVKLRSMSMDEQGLDMTIQQQPELAQYVGKCFAAMVFDSPNYTEMYFDINSKFRDKYQGITVHVQKVNGQTPHQLRLKAEQERDALRRELNKLKEAK